MGEFDMPLYNSTSRKLTAGRPQWRRWSNGSRRPTRRSSSRGVQLVGPRQQKNAIDWISRVRPVPIAGKSVFPCCCVAIDDRRRTGLLHFRVSLESLGVWTYPEGLCVGAGRRSMTTAELANAENRGNAESHAEDYCSGAQAQQPLRGSVSPMTEAAERWIGARYPRKEDAALLTGNARFIDDMEPVPGIRHVAMLRSGHAHARIVSIDISKAAAMPGVHGIVTGADIVEAIRPIPSAIRAPIKYYPIAIDKVRYVGEPVAVIAADDRYVAEDAMELIEVEYEPLPPVVDADGALADAAALLHEDVGSNVVHHRTFRYGDPEGAFSNAHKVVRLDWRYPRYGSTPMETYGVVANFERAPDRYTIWSNFQGPFILHALMTGALGVPGNRLRLITSPHSGGSFGIKRAMYPYHGVARGVFQAHWMPTEMDRGPAGAPDQRVDRG